jgi:6-phospho-3-hexuloisomerase
MTSDQVTSSQPWWIVHREISDLLAQIEVKSFNDLLKVFENRKRRWFFSGQGRSGLVAQMAAMRFMHLGYDAHVVGEVTAPSVREDDGLVLVCGSGQTPISLGFAGIAKTEKAMLAVITHKPYSKLAGMADVLLTIPMETTAQFGGTLFEQCCLILFDSIALRLAECQAGGHSEMWQRHTNMQ